MRGLGYVGMIGSKRKIRLIYEDLIARGIPEVALLSESGSRTLSVY